MLKYIYELWNVVKAIFGWLAAMVIVFIGIVLVLVAVTLVQMTAAAVIVFILVIIRNIFDMWWLF